MSWLVWLSIAIVLTASSLGGCSTAVIAAAGATAGFGLAQGQAEAFITGELKAARMVPMDVAERAVFDALLELRVPVKVHRTRDHQIYVMAKADGGPDLRFTLRFISPVATKFEIRVGMLGDQATSRLLLARVDAMLGIEQPIVPVEVSPIVAPPPPAPRVEKQEPSSSKSTPPSEPPP
jgi:hypothetical protein